MIKISFASFKDDLFELVVYDKVAHKAVVLEGSLKPGQLERVSEILPTCVFVPGEPAEPIGYVFETARGISYESPDHPRYINWGPPRFSFTKPNVPPGAIRNLRPLYDTVKCDD